MIATGPAMTLQVRDRDEVMEPHRGPARDLADLATGGRRRGPLNPHLNQVTAARL
jgi:hypothetical protein